MQGEPEGRIRRVVREYELIRRCIEVKLFAASKKIPGRDEKLPVTIDLDEQACVPFAY